MALIAPSVLAADFSNLAVEIKAAVAAGVETFHLDIMDGHFVCNISFGPDIAKEVITAAPGVPCDAHLMVTMPEDYVQPFADIGVELLTFHVELDSRRQALPGGRWVYGATEIRYTSRIEHLIKKIRDAGMKAGLAINPPTDPKVAAPFLDQIDRLLIMSVNPGFGGQKFIEETYQKIERAANFRAKKNLTFDIQVDGGVGVDNAGRLAELGVDNLVCGTSFFGARDYRARLAELHSAIGRETISR
ncbi:MAG TPA: ribulose-phosphate 3-epimerase [candidate division Zixibacteria bacterium]|nr:ribulose-phosphate 3-epimerase [candidate division Zixibacteria bacterium]